MRTTRTEASALRRNARWVFPAVLTAGLCLASPVHAAPDAPAESEQAKEEARVRFKRGVEFFRDGDFRAALIEFNRAYDAAPNPVVLYNIGQANIELQDHSAALQALERYLAEAGDIPPERRTEVEADVAKLKNRVGYLHLVVETPGADVSIDDVPIGHSPLDKNLVLNAGRRRVTVLSPPNPPIQRLVDLASGDHANVKIEPVTAPPPPPPQEPAPPSMAPVWIGLVTTGALAAGTTVAGLLSLSAKSDFDDAKSTYPTRRSDVEDARSRVDTFVTVTDVLLISAVVAGGITAVLALTRKSGPPPSTAAMTTVTPQGVFGRF